MAIDVSQLQYTKHHHRCLHSTQSQILSTRSSIMSSGQLLARRGPALACLPSRLFLVSKRLPYSRVVLREGRRKRGSCAVFGWFGGLKLGKKKNGHAKTKEGSRSEITLPVVPLQLLGLPPGLECNEEDIMKCYKDLKTLVVEAGYSAAALTGRLEVLEKAMNDAVSTVTKDDKKETPSIPVVTIAHYQLPGALALLEQVGEFDLVLEAGEKALENQAAGNRNDYLVAMAYSKLGKSDLYFEASQEATACKCMEEAYQLFSKTGITALKKVPMGEIASYIHDAGNLVVPHQLAMPLLMDNEMGRIDAIGILKDMMSPPGRSPRPLLDDILDRHCVKQSIESMRADELLNLMDWHDFFSAPTIPSWYYPGILLKVATAHIVRAYRRRDPGILKKLQKILSLPGRAEEAHIHQAVCLVLLGEVDMALEFLARVEGSRRTPEEEDIIFEGIGESGNDGENANGTGASKEADEPDETEVQVGGMPEDEKVIEVKGNGKEAVETKKDQQEGTGTDGKLKEGAKGDDHHTNSDNADKAPNANSDSLLQNAQGASQSTQGLVISKKIPKSGTTDTNKGGVGAKYIPGRNLTLAFIIANSPGDSSLLSGTCIFTERWIGKVGFEQFVDTQRLVEKQHKLSAYFEDEKIVEYLKAHGGVDPLSAEARQKSTWRQAQIRKLEEEVQREKEKANRMLSKKRKKREVTSKASTEPQPGTNRKPSPLFVALMGGVVLGAALFSYVYRPWLDEDDYVTLTEAQQAKVNTLSVDAPISMDLAETIVKKWQFAKSSALGAQYDTKYLGRILTPSLHEVWTARVSDVMKKGLHWKFNISKCKVTDVDPSKFDAGFGYVRIYAELGEAAFMCDGQEKIIDKFKTNYNVAYDVMLDPEGKWRLDKVTILKNQQ